MAAGQAAVKDSMTRSLCSTSLAALESCDRYTPKSEAGPLWRTGLQPEPTEAGWSSHPPPPGRASSARAVSLGSRQSEVGCQKGNHSREGVGLDLEGRQGQPLQIVGGAFSIFQRRISV